jgi:predicted kinase
LPLFVSLGATATGDAALAEAALAPAAPRLVAIGGLSGTGKSSLARLLGWRVGRTPGARVLRSDVFRKRLAGLAPEMRIPPAHYTRHSDEETYEAMFESADDHIACGNSVILDAVFMSRSERDVAEAIALRRRVPFTGIWLEAPERDRIARVSARDGDASDATVEVVREQSRLSVGELAGWHRMRVNRPLDLIIPAARAVLDRRP